MSRAAGQRRGEQNSSNSDNNKRRTGKMGRAGCQRCWWEEQTKKKAPPHCIGWKPFLGLGDQTPKVDTEESRVTQTHTHTRYKTKRKQWQQPESQTQSKTKEGSSPWVQGGRKKREKKKREKKKGTRVRVQFKKRREKASPSVRGMPNSLNMS